MSWINDLLGYKVFKNLAGVALPQRATVRVAGGLEATDDSVAKETVLTASAVDGDAGSDVLTEDVTYYVHSSTGSDDNDGLTEGAALATIAAAEALVPRILRANAVIVLLDVGPHDLPDFRARDYDDGFIYVRGAVDSELLASTVAAASSSQVTVKGTYTLGAHDGAFIEVLTGAAAGDVRSIRNTTTTDIIPMMPFSGAFAAGDTYRVFTPSVRLEPPTGGYAYLSGTRTGADPTVTRSLVFERCLLNSGGSVACDGSVSWLACASDRQMLGNFDGGRSGLSGNLAGVLSAAAGEVHGLASGWMAYFGAGLVYSGSNPLFTFGGFVAAPAPDTTLDFGGYCYLLGWSCGIKVIRRSEMTAIGTSGNGGYSPGYVVVDEQTNETEGEGKLTLAGATVGALSARRGSAVSLVSVTITGLTATPGIDVESGATVYVRGSVAVTSETYPVRARYGGRVYFDGAPDLTNSSSAGDDIAVGNTPDVYADTDLAAAGDASLPTTVIDGSIVQRLS